MTRFLLWTVLGCSMLSPAVAQTSLTPAEQRSTALSAEWQRRSDVVTQRPDGTVVFLFGHSQPSVVCSPLRLCDVELEAGETVLNVHAGDPVRWQFDGARSGPDGVIPHLVIKPSESGLETSLLVTTDRRTYHLNLKSARREYAARIAFDYSADPANAVRALALSAPPKVEPAAGAGIAAGDLSFDYVIEGKPRWRPVRVYDDGLKTYIDMPRAMRASEAPALLVLGDGGEEQLVNYRILDRRYVVDRIFDRAILIAGVGDRQSRVEVRRAPRDEP